jgi:hypothetical protein
MAKPRYQKVLSKDGSIIRPDWSLIEGSNRSDTKFPWNNNIDGNPTIESMLNHHLLGYRYDTEQPYRQH